MSEPVRITVINAMSNDIWYKTEENEEHLTKWERSEEESFNASAGISRGEDQGGEVSVGYETAEQEGRESEWSGFKSTGFTCLPSGQRGTPDREADEATYFFSAYKKDNEGKLTWITKGYRSANPTIRVRENGAIDHPTIRKTHDKKIKSGNPVILQRKDGGVIGSPYQWGSPKWDYAQFVMNKFAGKHSFHDINGKKELKAGQPVRIRCDEPSLANKDYEWMQVQESTAGYIFYNIVQKTDNKNYQYFSIEKVRGQDQSPGDDLCYGDEVRIRNLQFPNSYLSVTHDDYICSWQNDETTWILTK